LNWVGKNIFHSKLKETNIVLSIEKMKKENSENIT